MSGTAGQGLLQLGELGLALLLSALVGLEREWRQKSAGLRTHTLIGVSSALFMLISKYGFHDTLAPGQEVADPTRVAAQIVSGIGFLGGGVIFMRRDVVRGLTTAASIWLTAALGMACGAGLMLLAVATTAVHFVIMLGFPQLTRFLPRERRTAARLRITFHDRPDLLPAILQACTEARFAIDGVHMERDNPAAAADLADAEGQDAPATGGSVVLTLLLRGKRAVPPLVAAIAAMAGVVSAGTQEDGGELD